MKTNYQIQLEKFGLSSKEATVYETLLRIGSTSASHLANVTSLNRSTTYVQLKSLMNHGLVISYKQDKKTTFAAESPEKLKQLLDTKISEIKKQQEQITELLPDLAQAYLSHSVTPVIRHFQGKNGLASMRNEIFSSTDNKIRVIMNYDDLLRVFSKEELEAYSYRRKQQTIQSYIIYSYSDGVDFTPYHYQHLKRVQDTAMFFGCDVYIYGNTVSFAAMKSEVVGVSIDQADIADGMKRLFDTYWDFHPNLK